MKKCVIISCYIVNEFRRKLVQSQIDVFNKNGIDVILASSHHIQKLNNVKNYITCESVSDERYTNLGYSYFNVNLSGNNLKFWKGKTSNSIFYENYFIKMYQVVTSYVKNLGYSYMYFIDQDMVINPEIIPEILNPELDASKIHLYKWKNWYAPEDAAEYQVTFFHGNVKELNTMFTDEKLEELSDYSKKTWTGIEGSFHFLAKSNINVVSNVKDPYQMFEKVNLFSSSNTADVFFHHAEKRYIFLHSKGDISKHSIFSAEVLEGNEVIYRNSIKDTGAWSILYLNPNQKYTIKTYDEEISTETLYKNEEIYTDIETPCTINYITN